MDELDCTDAPDGMLEPGGPTAETDWENQADGDLLVDYAVAGPDDQAELDPSTVWTADDQYAGEDGPGEGTVRLSELIGGRLPRVLLRLVGIDNGVSARVAAGGTSAEKRLALTKLAEFVEAIFRERRQLFTDDEWDALMTGRGAGPFLRLVLLSRLTWPADRPIQVAESEWLTASNLGLERYRGKLAAMPDGTPFSIHLLLGDGRGARRGVGNRTRYSHGFAGLPAPVVLAALRRARSRERQNGIADDDYGLGRALREAVRELGVGDVRAPDAKQVSRLRERLARQQLPDELPNRFERQREYDAARRQETGARDPS